MSDAEEDYLSDKFLTETAPTQPVTYVGRRLQTRRESERKNVENRKKSRRERQEEALKEGLTKSLFDKVDDANNSKAMSMMLKMGYRPGESLGSETERHLTEPLPLNVWSGRQGVGKRRREPVSCEAAAKLAKVVQASSSSFRERAREAYEERRAQGRLGAATQTCVTLDEKAGQDFNVLWLNPEDPETFPPDLLDALIQETASEPDQLRRQMRADALQPVADLDDSEPSPSVAWPEEAIDEARQFIGQPAAKRLERVLAYLRHHYFYCFWCGTQYADSQDLAHHCPGLTEEDHD